MIRLHVPYGVLLFVYFASFVALGIGVSLALWFHGQWIGVVGIGVAIGSLVVSALALNGIINNWFD